MQSPAPHGAPRLKNGRLRAAARAWPGLVSIIAAHRWFACDGTRSSGTRGCYGFPGHQTAFDLGNRIALTFPRLALILLQMLDGPAAHCPVREDARGQLWPQMTR